MDKNIINKFGYAEMYEWEPNSPYISDSNMYIGRFVTFSKNNPDKIILANNNDFILGVTTVNFTEVSDNPDEWKFKYMMDEFGDVYVKSKIKYYGKKEYDDINEFYYINILQNKEPERVINQQYDKNIKYNNRLNRKEWTSINILGKCIVEDNGECVPGNFCSCGNNGIAIPGKDYYILSRISKNTIMILFK